MDNEVMAELEKTSQFPARKVKADLNDKAVKTVKRVLPVYKQTVDPWTEKAASEATCRKGCDSCCYNLAKATLAEGALVAATLIERGTFDKYVPGLERAAKVALEAEKEPDESLHYLKSKIPCAFLENGECSIYDVRPSVCRTYFVVSDPKMCSPDRPGAEVGVIDARGVMANFITRLIRDTGSSIPGFIGDFASVVLAGAEYVTRSSGSFKRWTAKSELFTKDVEII